MQKIIEKLHAKWRSAPVNAIRAIIALEWPKSQHQIADDLDISPGHSRYILDRLVDEGFITSKLEKSQYTNHKVRIYRVKAHIRKML